MLSLQSYILGMVLGVIYMVQKFTPKYHDINIRKYNFSYLLWNEITDKKKNERFTIAKMIKSFWAS